MKRNVLTKKNDKEGLEKTTEPMLSTSEILEDIAITLNKEKKRIKKIKTTTNDNVFNLREDALVKKGDINFDAPMPLDLATLKSLIQTIVRDEIRKNWKV